MSDYIDREAVVEAVKRCKQIGNTAAVDKFDVLNRVKIIPAAEVKPIVRSHWKCEGKGQYYCALCNKPAPTDLYSYCPWCGADMRGESYRYEMLDEGNIKRKSGIFCRETSGEHGT